VAKQTASRPAAGNLASRLAADSARQLRRLLRAGRRSGSQRTGHRFRSLRGRESERILRRHERSILRDAGSAARAISGSLCQPGVLLPAGSGSARPCQCGRKITPLRHAAKTFVEQDQRRPIAPLCRNDLVLEQLLVNVDESPAHWAESSESARIRQFSLQFPRASRESAGQPFASARRLLTVAHEASGGTSAGGHHLKKSRLISGMFFREE
jgi:hypothetical protein